MKKIHLFAIFFFVFSSLALGEVDNSVVRIVTNKKPIDISRPWQFLKVVEQNNLGVFVGNRDILTTAYAVEDATTVELQKFGKPQKHQAQVVFIDFEVNLAIIRANNAAFTKDLEAISIAGEININEEVTIYKAKDSYQLTAMPGHLSEVGVYNVATSTYSILTYLFQVQQKGLGWAEPVIYDDELVALTTGQDTHNVHAIPSALIRKFLDDFRKQPYYGFPSLGIRLAGLVDPVARSFYKLEGIEGGVRVSSVNNNSPFMGKLKANDVLLQFNGKDLSEHGYFQHPKWGRVHIIYLLNLMRAGESVNLTVMRVGKKINIAGKVTRYDSNDFIMPFKPSSSKTEYLIFGGIVLQEMSQSFLEQWGEDWKNRAPFDLLYHYEYLNDPFQGKHQLVMGMILADEFNRGYQKMTDLLLLSVNDINVGSIKEVRDALNSNPIVRNGEKFAKFKFWRDGGEIILPYKGLKAAHKRIDDTYSINHQNAFFESAL